MLRKLTSAQQNLILGKVAESRRPSRGGSRANSPGRGSSARSAIRTQPVSRSGSPGRNRNRITGSASKASSRFKSRDTSPTGRRTITKSRTTVSSRRGSRHASPTRTGHSAKNADTDKTVSVIRALSAATVADKRAGLAGLKRLLQKQVWNTRKNNIQIKRKIIMPHAKNDFII